MLKFEIDNNQYKVIETIHSFFGTSRTVIRYTKNLEEYKVDDDPWCRVSQSAKDWFNKHYSKHFK